MNEFWVIASIGHGGTLWLTQALNTRQDVTAYHELKQSSVGMTWDKAALYERRNKTKSIKYRPYFQKIRQTASPIVVDANSWVPWMLPHVNEVLPITRVIYLVRHGISQLNSLMNYSETWRNAVGYLTDGYLRPFWEIAGKPDPDWSQWTREERLALLWTSCAFMPNYLRDWGLNVEVYKLETLTRTTQLENLLPDMDIETLIKWQRNDINRKVPRHISRRPRDIWPTWSDEMRAAFARIGNPVLEKYGYEVIV